MTDKTVKPKFFNVYLDSEEIVRLLSDEDRGKLFSMLLSFARTGETPDISDNPALAIAFKVFAAQIERDFEAYEKKVTAGKKGGAPKGNRNASKQTSKNNQNNQEEEKEEDKEEDKEEEEEKDTFASVRERSLLPLVSGGKTPYDCRKRECRPV